MAYPHPHTPIKWGNFVEAFIKADDQVDPRNLNLVQAGICYKLGDKSNGNKTIDEIVKIKMSRFSLNGDLNIPPRTAGVIRRNTHTWQRIGGQNASNGHAFYYPVEVLEKTREILGDYFDVCVDWKAWERKIYRETLEQYGKEETDNTL